MSSWGESGVILYTVDCKGQGLIMCGKKGPDQYAVFVCLMCGEGGLGLEG